MAKYCEAHGVAASGFYNWRKRFEEEATEPSPFVEVLTTKGSDTRLNPKRFTDWRIELSLGDDLILRLR